MKIVQVLTYVSEDGAYGGPTAVAKVQCEYLARLGHDVHLVAGWDGRARLEIPGVHVWLHRVRRIPGTGFAGYLSPGVWRRTRRLSRSADVLHFHLARDLVQLPAAMIVRRSSRVVLQAHGMVRPDGRVLARALDWILVRPIYRRASAHLALTQQEVDDAQTVARRRVRVERIRNAVPLSVRQTSWPQSGRLQVLFLARLQSRKRPDAFVAMARELLDAGVAADFVLHGPDEGQLASVEDLISSFGLRGQVEYRGPLDPGRVAEVMAQSHVYVLPSVDEPFPMSLLEAMAAGLPAVITDRTGLSAELSERRSAYVTDGDPRQMAERVRYLSSSRAIWEAASEASRRDIAENFGPETLARELEERYRSA